MGDLISLAQHRNQQRPPREGATQRQQWRPSLEGEFARPEGVPPPVTFYFDLASPFTYLAAERVDQMLGRSRWSPAACEALRRHDPWNEALARDAAERRADQLRMPLVWPERPAQGARGAMRAALYAADRGRAAAFVIAASRLAFCGGFDLDDPDVLAEAAGAANLGLDECLEAARDRRIDAALETTGRCLLAAGVERIPAVQVGRSIFAGERRVAEAAAFARIAPPDPGERVRSTAR
jgi:2-hydroxychromene-2-carboxylate isomerase